MRVKRRSRRNMDVPPDLTNVIILSILKNIRPDTAEAKVSYVAATPKPRLVKLSVAHGARMDFPSLALVTMRIRGLRQPARPESG
jgi:hypothetical protein